MPLDLATYLVWEDRTHKSQVQYAQADLTEIMPPSAQSAKRLSVSLRITLRRYPKSYTLAAYVRYPHEEDPAQYVGVYDDIAFQGGSLTGGYAEDFVLVAKYPREEVEREPAAYLLRMREAVATHPELQYHLDLSNPHISFNANSTGKSA